MNSQEDHGGGAHQGSGEPRLLPAHDAIPGQDHFTPALQLLLQLGRFLSLKKAKITQITKLTTTLLISASVKL